MIRLSQNRYGKSDVRLMKVIRGPERHEILEYSVDIRLFGDFESGHTEGDNTRILPTDTMKNTVYALARKHDFDSPEQFAQLLAERFVSTQPQVSRATVEVTERLWDQMALGEVPEAHAFVQAAGERKTAFIDHEASKTTITSGVKDLVILKSADSGFSDFVEDEYTTLKATDDRVLATSLTARWTYAGEADFNKVNRQVRQKLLEVFAAHKSLSVQHTLYAMGKAVLEQVSEVGEIFLQMPNKHNLPVDLTPFGMDNDHSILMPIDEPSGFIEATLSRE